MPQLVWFAMVLIDDYLCVDFFGLVDDVNCFEGLCCRSYLDVFAQRLDEELLLQSIVIGLHNQISFPGVSLALGNSQNFAVHCAYDFVFNHWINYYQIMLRLRYETKTQLRLRISQKHCDDWIINRIQKLWNCLAESYNSDGFAASL